MTAAYKTMQVVVAGMVAVAMMVLFAMGSAPLH